MAIVGGGGVGGVVRNIGESLREIVHLPPSTKTTKVSTSGASYNVNVGYIDPTTGKWTGNPNLPSGGGGYEGLSQEQIAQQQVRQQEIQRQIEEQSRQEAERKRLADLKTQQEARSQQEIRKQIVAMKEQAESKRTQQTVEGDIVNFYNQPKGTGYLQEIINKKTGQTTYRTIEGGRAGETFAPTIKQEVTANEPIQKIQPLPQDGSIIPSDITSWNYSLGIEQAREQFKTTKGKPVQSIMEQPERITGAELRKSFIYTAIPYAIQTTGDIIRKVPGGQKAIQFTEGLVDAGVIGFAPPIQQGLAYLKNEFPVKVGEFTQRLTETKFVRSYPKVSAGISFIGGGIASAPESIPANFREAYSGLIYTAPVFAAFSPLLKTGIQDLKVNTYPGKSTSTYKEVQIPVVNPKGKLDVYSKYKITTITTPPTIEVTTGLREIYGLERIRGTIGNIRTSITATPFYAKSGKEFAVIESGARQKTISSVSGTMESVNLNKVYPKGVSAIDKRLIEHLAGKVPEKLTLKVFGKATDIYQESIYTGDIAKTVYYKGARKTALNTNELMKGFQPVGRRETINRFYAQVKEIATPKESKYELYSGRLVFKDISKPFARAIGKVQSMTGESVIFKDAIFLEKNPVLSKQVFDFGGQPPGLKANIPTSKAGQVSIPKFEPGIIAPPKVKAIRIPKPVSSAIEFLNEQPSGKVIISEGSAYAFGGSKYRQSLAPDLGYVQISPQLSLQQPNLIQLTQNKIIQIQEPKIMQKIEQKILQKEGLKIMQKTGLKINEKLIQKIQQKTAQKQIHKLQQKLQQKQQFKSIFAPPSISQKKTTERKGFLFPRPYTPKLKLSTSKYTVSVRRFGKFRPIGVFGSARQAFEVGKSRVGKTLAASFKVSGIPQTAQLPSGYYRSKREPSVIIQQPKFRLSSLTERAEIKSYARTKRRRK